jgi:hypothetical protein
MISVQLGALGQRQTQMAALHMVIQGRPREITLYAFLTAIENVQQMLADLDSAISEEPHGSLDWVVADLSMGSLSIALESQPRLEDSDVGPEVAHTIVRGLSIIESEGRTPPLFTESSMRSAQRLVNVIGRDGATGLMVTDLEQKVTMSAQASASIGQLLKVLRRAIGSVEGRLETISVHGKPKFIVYHSRTNKGITCILPPEELVAKTIPALGHRVTVSGTVFSNARGEPMRIQAERIRIIPNDEELPTIDEIGGSDPDFTGDMTTEEYIRNIRVG